MRNWDDLRIFLALIRSGSPHAAGRQLKIDESTVRRRLSALERDLQMQLVERAGYEWRSTRAGDMLAEQAKVIERGIAETVTRFDADEPSLVGNVRVGSPDGYASYVIMPALIDLQRRAPELLIELLCFNSPADISRREVDLLLVTEPPTSGHYRIRKLPNVALGLYGSRDYLAQNGVPQSRNDLAQHWLVGYDPSSQYARVAVSRLTALEIGMTASITCNTLFAQLRAVQMGAGLAFLPSYVVEPHLGLERLLEGEIGIEIELWLLVHADVAARGRVRATVDAIVAAAGKA